MKNVSTKTEVILGGSKMNKKYSIFDQIVSAFQKNRSRQEEFLNKVLKSVDRAQEETSSEIKDIWKMIKNGDTDALENIPKNDPIFNEKDKKGHIPLSFAIHQNNADVVKILCRKGSPLTFRDEKENTPVWYCFQNESPEVLRILLEEGQNPNESLKGTTLLMKSCQQNYYEYINLLLKFRVDINAKDYKDKKALNYADEKGKKIIKEFKHDKTFSG